VSDPERPGGWMLVVDGVEQSYVDIRRPRYLYHVYVRHIASIVDVAARRGEPLRVLHLGGGALTLPRYVAATRPGSVQWVVERDAALDTFIRQRLPLPAGADIRTVIGDARDAVEAMRDRFDLVISDVFDGADMPDSVASVEFAELVTRVLDPAGTYVVNVTDQPPSMQSRLQAATLRPVFPDVWAVGEAGMFRGRKYGNVVFAAGESLTPVRLARLERMAERDPARVRVLSGAALDRFIGTARPRRDSRASRS
jgi:spermidine synthase